MAVRTPSRRAGGADGPPPVAASQEERVLFRERRRPPLLGAMLAPAAVLATLAVDAAPAVRLLLAAGAAAFLAAGILLRRRVWIEDLVVTDVRVLVAPSRGPERWLALREVDGVSERGLGLRFHARGGEALSFAYVRDAAALRRALAGARPDVQVAADDRAHCRTCGIRF